MVPRAAILASLLLFADFSLSIAFMVPSQPQTLTTLSALNELISCTNDDKLTTPSRRSFLSTASNAAAALLILPTSQAHAEEPTDFESIAQRATAAAAKVAESEAAAQAANEAEDARKKELASKLKEDTRTIYEFTLPVSGKQISVAELVGQTFEGNAGEGGAQIGAVGSKVKAILVVNIKQDGELRCA